TPPTDINGSQELTNYLTSDRDKISTSHHVVPASLLGASSLSPQLPNSTVWNTTTDPNTGHTYADPSRAEFSWNVRHNFAFSTCNGCHYLETANPIQLLFHINPRAPGVASALSPFLDRALPDPSVTGLPSDYLQVPDPSPDSYDFVNGNPYYFQYNE